MKKILLLVLGLCLSMTVTAQNFSDVIADESVSNLPAITTQTEAIVVNQTGRMASTLITDRPTFQAACAVPPALMLEDFDGGPGAGIIQTCGNTLSAAGDSCFPAGEILPGVEITRSGGAGVVYVGVGWSGYPYPEPYVGSNTFTTYTIINLTQPTSQVGFDLISLRSGNPADGNNGGDIDVRVYGNSGLIDTYTITLTGSNPSFVGIVGDEAITRLELQDPTGQDVELVANLEFGDCGLPMIVCPSDVVVDSTPGACGAVVGFAPPLVSDDEDDPDPVPVQTAGLPSGSLFPVGINVVEFVVTDSDGLTATCSFTITVNDVEAPTLTCTDTITVGNDPGICGAVVTFDPPVVNDNCPEIMSADIPGFTTLGLFQGKTYYLSDNNFTGPGAFADAIANGGFVATVTSAEVDTFIFNAITNEGVNNSFIGFNDVAVEGTFVWQSGAPVTYTNWGGSEPNNSGGNEDYTHYRSDGAWNDINENNARTYVLEIAGGLEQTAGLPSGSEFPVGTSTIEWTYTDSGGNVATCTHEIIVEDTEAPVIVCEGDFQSQDIMLNGSFETGDLSDWTAVDNP
ncbi:HYR domain-containing protein, partial [Aureisphaera galaxeae]|uniref:HYR domain-containing protein n=1 Tax=Aureisphaera galaxeae TaxID=1538023 RepID=UPI00234FF73B